VIYTHASLDALSHIGDELADATVAALFERGEMSSFSNLMRWFTRSGQPLPDGLPVVAREYLEATRLPPDWVDWDVMEKARLFFVDNNVHISTALAFCAMPCSFALPGAARLMRATHSLQYPSKRMAATGQFAVFLMQSDAFDEGGAFIPAAQKVRLLHASIRHHLRREGLWDELRDGASPLHQEGLIGAQTLFSLGVLDALHRMGIHMSDEGAEAHFYAWAVVAAMLGCDQTASPRDVVAGRAFNDLFLLRNLGPSPEGAHLTRQLIELYEETVPGTLFDPLVPAMIRFLVGPTIADWLEVPRSAWDIGAIGVTIMLRVLEHVEDSNPLAAWLLDRAGRLTTNCELTSLTRGRVMHYSIPDSLKSEYGLGSTPSRAGRWTPPPASIDVYA
jgi:hypothetical protein